MLFDLSKTITRPLQCHDCDIDMRLLGSVRIKRVFLLTIMERKFFSVRIAGASVIHSWRRTQHHGLFPQPIVIDPDFESRRHPPRIAGVANWAWQPRQTHLLAAR